MSAFLADGDFVPRLPAHPLRADAPTDPSFGRLIATRRHSMRRLRPLPNDRDRPTTAIRDQRYQCRLSDRKADIANEEIIVRRSSRRNCRLFPM